MEEPPDGTLLRSFRDGDTSALTRLVARHQGVLMRHARSILGQGGPYEDVVQEVFLRLVQTPPEVRGDALAERAQLSSWLHKVVRNCCMDTLRSEQRRKRREEGAAAPDVTQGEVSLLEERDTRAAVERGLNRLPTEQREVLVLRLLAERSYKEIAEITGKKVGTVGWLVSVGLKALAEHLGPLLGTEAALSQTQAGRMQPGLGFAQGERS
jgi:RNA polymerase sigma-70 factor (ECF subfamily)